MPTSTMSLARSCARIAFVAFLTSPTLPALELTNARLASEPAISSEQLVFAYANDLWIAHRDGTSVRRLTAHAGVESGPAFSPDGSLIAFTGRYEGNTDVYLVSAAGGLPRRLTYHPGDDTALGFTPDGQSVLFSSGREVYTGRYTQLFTVPVGGGFPSRLPIPSVDTPPGFPSPPCVGGRRTNRL